MSHSITYADGTREVLSDNGNGTGTHRYYDAAGNETDSVAVTGLPLVLPLSAAEVARDQLIAGAAALQSLGLSAAQAMRLGAEIAAERAALGDEPDPVKVAEVVTAAALAANPPG